MHGALSDEERDDWAWASEAAARDVAEGRADQGIVCCWTGTGASIAANKVPGVRAALCGDAETARGARKWNDANVLALSLRTTSPALLEEILDGWFEAAPSTTRTTWRTSATWTRSASAGVPVAIEPGARAAAPDPRAQRSTKRKRPRSRPLFAPAPRTCPARRDRPHERARHGRWSPRAPATGRPRPRPARRGA